MKRPVLKIGMLLLCSLVSSVSLHSQTTEDKTLSPYFVVLSDDPAIDQLPLKRTSAEVNIVGVIADVSITQVYKNEGLKTLEAVYTFPTSTKAAIYAMEMHIGTRRIVAKIEEKDKARNDYENAKEQGKRASLLEQQRPNVFQMNVANILPGDEIEVLLKYTELLVPEKGIYEFVYPTVVGPRFTGGSDPDNPANQFTSTPYQKQGEPPLYEFGLKVSLSTGVPIQNVDCPSHNVFVDYSTADRARIELDASEKNGGNRDFILHYSLAGEQIVSGLMLYEHGDENFYLATIQPPAKITEENIPPREYIFIVDVSGSMRGFPLETSKKLLRDLVVNLRPTDKFNVLLFAGTSGWLNETSVYANTSNINRAINVIDNQRGGGGTQLLPAIKKALAMLRDEEALSRSLVVVTDGYISVERQAFDLIRNDASQANVFVFGIGSGVNRYLIEGLAHAGQGEPMIVTDQAEAHQQAEKFRQYINRPVLTQIKVDFGSFDVYDNEPISVADVLAERPIILFGKYRGTPQGKIIIKGFAGKKKYKTELDVSQVQADENNAAIRYLWARERIKILGDYGSISRRGDEKEAITQLGMQYNLMTAYTSFIAIDEQQIVNDLGQLVTVKQALPLPKGVANSAVGADAEIVKIVCSEAIEAEEFELDYLANSPIVNTSFSDEDKLGLTSKIEEELLAELETCFASGQAKPDEIEIAVDATGKVKAVKVLGIDVNEKIRQCVLAKITKWDFSDWSTGTDWEIKIYY